MKRFVSLLFAAVLALSLVIPVLAAGTYGTEVTVMDTSGVARAGVPSLADVDCDSLVDLGYLDAAGLYTRLFEGTTEHKYMVASDKLGVFTPSLSADQERTYRFGTGYSPENDSFGIIAGTGGYVTIPDDPTLELNTSPGGMLEVFSSTSDGMVYKSDAVYNTAWTAASGILSGGATAIIGQNQAYSIYRSYFYFDTSSIPESSTITAAELKLAGQTDQSSQDFYITIQSGQPSHPEDPLVAGDYDKSFYSGDGGSLTTAGLVISGYNTISLNTTGLSWIDKGGVTKLCVRSDRDIAGTTPTTTEHVTVYTSDQGGTTYDPKLIVYYDPGPADFEIETSGYVDTSTIGGVGSVSPYSTSSDGHNYGTSTVYATVWEAASATKNDTNDNALIGQLYSAPNYSIWRSYLYFDTSGIPDDALITSATLKLYGNSDSSNPDFLITIQNGQPTYPHNPLENGDYDKSYYSGDGGSLTTVGGFSTTSYNDIVLNSTGLGWIDAEGTTKLCLRSDREIAGTVPTTQELVYFWTSEEPTKEPILEVHYLEGALVSKEDALLVYVNGEAQIRSVVSPEVGYDFLFPNGVGDVTQLTDYPSAGGNWEDVDDPIGVPDEAATYVYNGTEDTTKGDVYALTDTVITEALEISEVRVYFRHRQSYPQATDPIYPVVRLGGEETVGSGVTSTAWTTSSEALSRPGGGAWQLEDLDSLQAGVQIYETTYSGQRQCTQVYVRITYTNWGAEVTAYDVDSSDYVVVTSIGDSADFDDYATDASVAVNMGGGLVPVFLLEKQELTSAVASVIFSDIDSLVAKWNTIAGVTSRHLVVLTNVASDQATTEQLFQARFNGDAGANYNIQRLQGTSSSASAAEYSNQSALTRFNMPGTSYPDSFGGGTLLVPYAFNTSNHKSTLYLTGSVEETVVACVGRWASTSAITSVTFSPNSGNFAAGSTFWLGVVDERYLVEEDLLTSAGTITFDSIPQDGSDLCVIGYMRGSGAGFSQYFDHEINDDTTATNYWHQYIRGVNNVPSAAGSVNTQNIGYMPILNSTANSFGAFVASYSQYAETDNDILVQSLSGIHEAVSPDTYIYGFSARWDNTSAVTKLEYYATGGGSFEAGTLFSLYRVPRYTIDRQELAGSEPSIVFDDIPQGYSAIQLNIYSRTDRALSYDYINVEINDDTTASNYDMQVLRGEGANATAARNVASQGWIDTAGNTLGANVFAEAILVFPNYSKDDRNKHLIIQGSSAEYSVRLRSCRWESNSPVTKIELTPAVGDNFIAGTIVELVGVMPSNVFQLIVDDVVKAVADGNGISITENDSDWVIGQGNVLPYIDYYKHTVGEAVQAWYQPNYIIDDTALLDRSMYGLSFPGVVGDYVVVSDSDSLDLTSAITIEMWVKPSTVVGTQELIAKDQHFISVGSNVYGMELSGDTVIFSVGDGVGNEQITSTETVSADIWYYLAGTWDATSKTVTINDTHKSAASTIANIQVVGDDVWIGQNNNVTYPRNFFGVIDEIRIYGRVLPEEEKESNYSSGVGSYAPYSTVGLVGWWHVEEGTGETLIDYSVEGNTGTLEGGVTWATGIVERPAGESGTNDAIITWGANEDLEVVVGGIQSITSYTSGGVESQDPPIVLPLPGADLLPPEEDPSALLPWFDLFDPASEGLEWQTRDLYGIMAIFVGIGVGTGVMIATGSVLLAAIAVGIGLSVGATMGVLGFWVVLVYAVFAGSYLVASRSM